MSSFSLAYWALLGLAAGWIANALLNRRYRAPLENMFVGLVGAMVGGALFTALGTPVRFGFDLRSLLVAVVGAVIVLILYNAARGPRRYR